MKYYFETFRIGAAASGRPIPDGELVWRGHMPRPRGARRESSPSHLHERGRLGPQGEGQGVLRCKRIMADVSRNPREHWLKPLFSKNEVAKSGPAFHSNGNPERGFGIYVARNINTKSGGRGYNHTHPRLFSAVRSTRLFRATKNPARP